MHTKPRFTLFVIPACAATLFVNDYMIILHKGVKGLVLDTNGNLIKNAQVLIILIKLYHISCYIIIRLKLFCFRIKIYSIDL